jgi:sentrin-specific protease 1
VCSGRKRQGQGVAPNKDGGSKKKAKTVEKRDTKATTTPGQRGGGASAALLDDDGGVTAKQSDVKSVANVLKDGEALKLTRPEETMLGKTVMWTDEYGESRRGIITAEPTDRQSRRGTKVPLYDVELSKRKRCRVRLHPEEYDKTWWTLSADTEEEALYYEASEAEIYAIELANLKRCKKPLDTEENRRVDRALHAREKTVVVDAFNVTVTGLSAARLLPGRWLNDELVNIYMGMLTERDGRLVARSILHKPCYFFNSFFIPKLMGEGEEAYSFEAVRRWTKHFDFFSQRLVLMPINIGYYHWCLLAVDLDRKEVRFYDSCGGSGSKYMQAVMLYLADEHNHSHELKFDPEIWTMVRTTADTPRQSNSFDCGVFVSYCALYLAHDLDPTFSQSDIPHLRRRMMSDILNKRLDL